MRLLRESLSNKQNIIISEFAHWVSRSWVYWWNPPSSGMRLPQILRGCSKFKVIGITARRVIASMKHIKSKIEVSKRKPIRKSVRFPVPLFVCEKAVSQFTSASHPQPAFIQGGSNDFGPKSFGNLFGALYASYPSSKSRLPSGLFGNKLFDIHGSLPACADTQRAFLF